MIILIAKGPLKTLAQPQTIAVVKILLIHKKAVKIRIASKIRNFPICNNHKPPNKKRNLEFKLLYNKKNQKKKLKVEIKPTALRKDLFQNNKVHLLTKFSSKHK